MKILVEQKPDNILLVRAYEDIQGDPNSVKAIKIPAQYTPNLFDKVQSLDLYNGQSIQFRRYEERVHLDNDPSNYFRFEWKSSSSIFDEFVASVPK